jgi:1-phosphatidylinositol phosphodiesterase
LNFAPKYGKIGLKGDFFMKNTLTQIVNIVLIAAICFFAIAPIESPITQKGVRWMADLEDERAINELSIPGTHDSGATHSIADVAGRCQSLSIEDQLYIGVRFLDIRLQLVGDELMVVHSFVDQRTEFEDVLEEIVEFVEENPTEFLFISIKEDADPKRPERDFTAILEGELREYERISESETLPKTVGEARGKIYVISRYAGATMGIPAYYGWEDSTSFTLGELYVQDNYRVDSAEEKIADIEATMAVADKCTSGLVLNFTSCYLTSGFPPTYAATPAKTVNPWLIERLYIEARPQGVLVCDFITSEMSKAIWEVNFR